MLTKQISIQTEFKFCLIYERDKHNWKIVEPIGGIIY
jgi:hypothetical protein